MLPGRTVAVTASTGAAAILVEGATIFSWAGIQLGRDAVPALAAMVGRSKPATARWRTSDVLVIDEISMLDPEVFRLFLIASSSSFLSLG